MLHVALSPPDDRAAVLAMAIPYHLLLESIFVGASLTNDGLGRTLSTTLPGEGTRLTTTQLAYSPITTCPTTGASAPCLEVDTTQRLDSGHTVMLRHFYDGWGHEVETRRPASYGSNFDGVQFTMYDVLGRVAEQSMPYFVTAYTGSGMGPAAYGHARCQPDRHDVHL
jgi:hypothetical protein